MTITGTRAALVPLSTPAGRRVQLAIVEPDASATNLKQMRQTADVWDRQGDDLETKVGEAEAVRAWFASDALMKAGIQITRGDCCVLVGQDADTGEVLAVALYEPDGGEWWIHFFAIAPSNQPGYPNADQVRGIGSAMLGAIADKIAADPGCKRVQLYALDSAAERFWRARGFHDTIQPLHLSCEETARLPERVRAVGPEGPGELPEAEDPELMAYTSPPRIRAKLEKYRQRQLAGRS